MQVILWSVKTCLKDKLFVSGGRGSRNEFWYFFVISLIIRAPFLFITMSMTMAMVVNVLHFILFLANYSSAIRRLHDTNRSASHMLVILGGIVLGLAGFFLHQPMLITGGEIVMVAGVVYLLVLCALPGTAGANKFGPEPELAPQSK